MNDIGCSQHGGIPIGGKSEQGTIKFLVPSLGKEVSLRLVSDYLSSEREDNKLYFYGVTDFYIENNIIIMDAIINNYGSQSYLYRGVHLKYDITDKGMILIDLVGPR